MKKCNGWVHAVLKREREKPPNHAFGKKKKKRKKKKKKKKKDLSVFEYFIF